MQPIYYSAVFACETSDDDRRVQCDFRHCNLHFRSEKGSLFASKLSWPSYLGFQKTSKNTSEKKSKIDFPEPKTIGGEWDRDQRKIQKIESTTRKASNQYRSFFINMYFEILGSCYFLIGRASRFRGKVAGKFGDN